MILTPGPFVQRADFYHQLSQLTAAGLGLVSALQQMERNPPASSYRAPLRRVLASIGEGATLSEALKSAGRWLPEFDITIIEAGEKSGRLDASFRLLADYYTDRARLVRQMINDLLYPVFLFHFAVLVSAFLQFIRSANWLVVLLGGLLPVYALVFAGIYAAQSSHGESWRSWVERLLDPIPVLGTARRYLAIARLSAALEALLSAGVSIVEAWELAAAASGSPVIRRTVENWRPMINAGQTPAEIVMASPPFPQMFAHQYHSGEVSGKLDETLRRLHGYYSDEGSRKMHLVSQWIPRFIYLGVALVVAYIVVRFYVGRFQELQNVINF